MKLRDEIHRSIDVLDNHALVAVYEQVQLLLKAKPDVPDATSAPSLDEVLKLTRSDLGDWATEIVEAREDRL